jgi:dihydrofolate reductase
MNRPISAELFVSLDLVVEEPRSWHFPWVRERMLAEVAREQTTSTLLLGRTTYDSFASAWPHLGDEVPLARQLNDMQKVVVSDRLSDDDATWTNTHVLRPAGDFAGAIASLDTAGDDRITVAGSPSIVEQLLAAGLLAELRLIVHPIVVGTGRRLFDGWDGSRVEFEHTESSPLDQGARVDVYRPLTARTATVPASAR